MEEKLSIIRISTVKKRIKREIDDLVSSNICKYDNIFLELCDGEEYEVNIILYANDLNIYKFGIHKYYPFRPPKLYINNNPYLSRHNGLSTNFQKSLKKYSDIDCFCCQSILCSDNWSPKCMLINVLNERDKYKEACREVVNRIIVDVIIRKYLISDINIIQWLY